MIKEDIEKELLKRRLKKAQSLNESKPIKQLSINEEELVLTLEMAIEKTLIDNGLLD